MTVRRFIVRRLCVQEQRTGIKGRKLEMNNTRNVTDQENTTYVNP